ncbi:MAG: dodecin domain-containing protein [Gammaproteobacteria bacterium]|nr:MAG: dodecin domain-containing protein [Gammaproteobacteria bacterium]
MKEHTYKQIEITGSSEVGTDEAIRNAISKASKTIRNMDWFEVVNTRGNIDTDTVHYWQVTIKIGFRLED